LKIAFVTTNKGKFAEIDKMIRDNGHEPEHIPVAYPEMQTDSLEMVVIQGLYWLIEHYNKPLLCDDSGLFVDAIGGFPGVYSAYAFKNIGCDGILKLMDGKKDRNARFECCLGFIEPGKEPLLFRGTSEGTISHSQKGDKGFGFDPIFVPDGYEKTFSELSMDIKNKISHRGRAFDKFFNYLKEARQG